MCWPVWFHITHERTALTAIVRKPNTDHRLRHFPLIHQLLRDAACLVDGDGKAQADGTGLPRVTRVGGNHRVHANEPPLHVHQWPAGVAGVDGGISLHGVDKRRFTALAPRGAHRTVEGGNDTAGHSGTQPQRRANGYHLLAHLQFIGVAETHNGQVRCIPQLNNRNVGGTVTSNKIGLVFFAVVQ